MWSISDWLYIAQQRHLSIGKNDGYLLSRQERRHSMSLGIYPNTLNELQSAGYWVLAFWLCGRKKEDGESIGHFERIACYSAKYSDGQRDTVTTPRRANTAA